MMNLDDPFQSFLDKGYDTIEGWPGKKDSVSFLKVFRELFGVRPDMGGACEVGVHHGKYFIALHNLLGGDKLSIGLDLFERQERNVDASGRGSWEICLANVEKYARNPSLVKLLRHDSITLKPSQIRDQAPGYVPFSIVSLDGGHTPLHIVRDFLFASDITSEEGIIAVDDIFHPDWPGVTEGLYSVLNQKVSPFVPFFMTRKKIFCCSASVQHKYKEFVGDKATVKKREVKFCGWDLLSLNFGGEY